MIPPKLKKNQKRRYLARVHDLEGDHPKHAGRWFRATTRSNPGGLYGTRAQAQDALERAVANYPHGKLSGHTADIVVDAPVTLENIVIDDYLSGDVKPIRTVPAKYRDQYEDTLRRAALAVYRAGTGPVWVNESFRTRAEQQHFYDLYLAGGNLAAKPGTGPHEFGIALDIPNVRYNKKLIKHLRRLQLIDDVPSEAWHVTNHHRA